MDISYKGIALFALIIPLSLTANSAQQTASKAQARHPANTSEQIVLTVSVIDKKGNFVAGLSRDSFNIFVDEMPARIIYSESKDSPISIGILFDASGSVGFRPSLYSAKLKILKQALGRFLELSHRSNDYFLLGFSSSPQLLVDWTSDPKPLVEKLDVLQPRGNTAFFDACYLAIDKVQKGRHGKHALIVISDGQDNQSHYSFKDLRQVLQESDVLIYSVNFTDWMGTSSGIVSQDIVNDGQDVLNEVSSISGGMSFFKIGVNASAATSVFEMIASELRNQYTVAIMTSNLGDDKKWHKLKAKVSPVAIDRDTKHLLVRTREGFYLHR